MRTPGKMITCAAACSGFSGVCDQAQAEKRYPDICLWFNLHNLAPQSGFRVDEAHYRAIRVNKGLNFGALETPLTSY